MPPKRSQKKSQKSSSTKRGSHLKNILYKTSKQVQDVIGTTKNIPRSDYMKLIWEYIHAHPGIQDGRNINCDSKLFAIYGKKNMTMFDLAKVPKMHLDRII